MAIMLALLLIIPGKTYPADQPFLQFLPPNLTESQIWPLFERTVHPKSITKINRI
jgi:hypothetical protein